MLARDFELGKVYSNEKYARQHGKSVWWWITRYDADRIVCVKVFPEDDIWKPFEYTDSIQFLSSDYEEVFDVPPEIQVKIDEWMHKYGTVVVQKTCTCDISILMISGCQCGWIQTERGKK